MTDSLLTVLNDTVQATNIAQPMPHMGMMVLRMLASLTLIVVLIFLMFHLLRKINLPKQQLMSGNPSGKVLDSLPINNRQTIQIVYLLERIYVLAVSPEEIRTIDILTDANEVQTYLQNYPNSTSTTFSSILSKLNKREKNVTKN